MRKLEVRLVLKTDEVRLTLSRDGQKVDTEVFLRSFREGTLRELAQTVFDDAYDLVNYADGGDE